MNLRKRLALVVTIVLSLLGIALISFWGFNRNPVMSLTTLYELIEQEEFNDLSLTVYYLSSSVFTWGPLSEVELVDSYSDFKVAMYARPLSHHSDLLKQLNNVTLVPVEHVSRVDARLHYVFESKKYGKFKVSMWGDNYSMFVNGVEIEENYAFYSIIKPFLPDYVLKELEWAYSR